MNERTSCEPGDACGDATCVCATLALATQRLLPLLPLLPPLSLCGAGAAGFAAASGSAAASACGVPVGSPTAGSIPRNSSNILCFCAAISSGVSATLPLLAAAASALAALAAICPGFSSAPAF